MNRVIVVGGGTMGAGIALVAAHAGYDVDLIEPDANAQARAGDRIAKDAARLNSDAPSRIAISERLPGQIDALLGIEAVPERLELKRAVFAQLANALPPQALLATNTSSLSVAEIAEGITHPERIIGLHFFNPPLAMKLVEIIHTGETSDDALAEARAFVERIEKTAVTAADTPGFIVNRVARPYYLQAMRAYEAGVAPIEDLDRLARGAGFRMGPFELMDLIGIDVNLATSESIYERTGVDRLEPLDLQRALVAQNQLGRKSGRGFYSYPPGPPQRADNAATPATEKNADERIVIVGWGGAAENLFDRLGAAFAHVERLENEDDVDSIDLRTTIVFDAGSGASDRAHVIEVLDRALPPETVIFADAYVNGIEAMASRLRHPERLAGYGILSSLEHQRVVEIVDSDSTPDDMLELAQEIFGSIGCDVALVADHAGLFLGRTVGSIVNEAVCAVEEGIASPDDVDLAMRLGTNYPWGPISWGREIGGARIGRILQQLARAEGAAFAPHRALWVLDVEDSQDEEISS
ncbi:MAG TPA: 3-hydroxyacyl-CoA dehydrogenase NAD-binding domain-containing protein [Candidatus Baltobacteraceae bacterium]|nr:3-hydroxyacyl-CoA dehydrogenase NAD-binding domain-containing protein [Candidatus Baltobacteraceae bacterium]